MPKGQKFVDWTNPDNDKKLLHSIIAAADVNVNYDKVAQYFGGGVPASSIATRMAKLRKESRDKGLMEPSATEPAAASKKIGGISTGASQQSAKGVMAETQVDSDESEIGVNVKKEEAIEDDEKPAIKKNAKELTKAKGEKTITGRVSKPRAQSSTPKKKPGKAKQSNKNTGESTGQDENAAVGKHGMTPESMASNNDYTEANGMQATDVNGEAEMVEV